MFDKFVRHEFFTKCQGNVNLVEIMIFLSSRPWNLQYVNLVEIMILLSRRPLESAICEFSGDYDIVK